MPLPTETMTRSGKLLDLASPRAELISPQDIANALTAIPRFLGHTLKPWSVLEHSVLVARLAQTESSDPYTHAHALLHDAHEAYIADLPQPVKALLGENLEYFPHVWDWLEKSIDIAIKDRLGLPELTASQDALIQGLDAEALGMERAVLMPHAREWELPCVGVGPLLEMLEHDPEYHRVRFFRILSTAGAKP